MSLSPGSELIGATKVESLGPQDYHEEGAHHHHHGHHHGDGRTPALDKAQKRRERRRAARRKQREEEAAAAGAERDWGAAASDFPSDSSYSSYSDSDFSDDEDDDDGDWGGKPPVFGGEAKGEDAASGASGAGAGKSVLSIEMFVDARASLRPTASCPFPRINWKGTRVYKRWLKGHMPVLNRVLVAFLELPHDHMSLYADYSPYVVDPPERFVEILRDMHKEDPE